MARVECLCLLLITCVLARASSDVSKNLSSVKASSELPLESRETEASDTPVAVRSVLECVLSADWTCVQVKTMRAIRLWFKMGTVVESSDQSEDLEVESKEGEGEDHREHEEVENSEDGGSSGGGQLPGHSLLEQLADAIVDGVSAIFFTDNEEERRGVLLRGSRALDLAMNQLTVSGRKKGGIGGGHDHHGVGELISVIMMLKASLMAIGTGFSTLIQLKSFAFTILGLLISLARFFMQVKQMYHPTPPPVVKVFQISQVPEQHEVIHSLPEAYVHHPHLVEQQLQHEHHHYDQHDALSAHDRVYTAQKPAALRKPTPVRNKQNKQNQPIFLVPNKP